jgi:hypothetical protein
VSYLLGRDERKQSAAYFRLTESERRNTTAPTTTNVITVTETIRESSLPKKESL